MRRTPPALLMMFALAGVFAPAGGAGQAPEALPFPALLEREALAAGNPLATYAAMLRLEAAYLEHPAFSRVYPELRAAFEEFLGDADAGVRAMSLPAFRHDWSGAALPDGYPERFRPVPLLEHVATAAARTRLVILGEEHHLPQTRSMFEGLLDTLWQQGYRYLAAETFGLDVMLADFRYPTQESGFYLRDPVFAEAVRHALRLGYRLVAYEATERPPEGDPGFRDRRQAERLIARTFARDSAARVLVLAGRGHASEATAQDGWRPMAAVVKELTGIDPLTLYAPTMSARATRAEEHPLYIDASERGWVEEPVVLVSTTDGAALGSESFDAYVFWPRPALVRGRPDWLARELGRTPVELPAIPSDASGLRLLQAFHADEPVRAVPADQVLLRPGAAVPALMLDAGAYRVRVIGPDGAIGFETRIDVP